MMSNVTNHLTTFTFSSSKLCLVLMSLDQRILMLANISVPSGGVGGNCTVNSPALRSSN